MSTLPFVLGCSFAALSGSDGIVQLVKRTWMKIVSPLLQIGRRMLMFAANWSAPIGQVGNLPKLW